MNKQQVCIWNEDDDGSWDTSCGDKHCEMEHTPEGGGFKFCCYCGKPLIERTYYMLDEEFEAKLSGRI